MTSQNGFIEGKSAVVVGTDRCIRTLRCRSGWSGAAASVTVGYKLRVLSQADGARTTGENGGHHEDTSYWVPDIVLE